MGDQVTPAASEVLEPMRFVAPAVRDFLEASAIPAHIVDAGGTILWANKAELDLLGYSGEEYFGRNVAELHVETEVARDLLRRLADGETIKGREVALRHKDGSTRWAEVTSNVQWEDGRFVHTRCFTVDVTERRLVQEQAAAELARQISEIATLHDVASELAAIVESSDDAIVSKSLDGTIHSWNGGASRIFGYTENEAIGKSIKFIIPPELHGEEDEILSRIRRGDRVEHYETVRIAKDGRRVDISLTISPVLDRAGKVVGASKVGRDITAKKAIADALRASEERHRQLLGLLPVAVYACEAPSGVITYYNDEAAKLWGRTPRVGDVEERFCACYKVWTLDGQFIPRNETPMAAAVRQGVSFRDQEAVVERPDGTRFTAVVNIDPIRDPEGRIVGAINVFYDVTDRRRAEAALRASEGRLVAEARALARLNEASSRLWRTPDLQEGLQEMLNATIELLGADMGNVQILEGKTLRIAAQRGFDEEFLELFREVSTDDDSACGRALRGGERMVIPDVEADAPYAPLRDVARKAGYRAVQSTPLVGRDGTPLGMISTHWRGVHEPDEQDLRRLDLYTRQAADFIERRRAEEQLREADRRKDEFIAVLSHELRNPLAPLRSALDLLRLGTATEDIRAMMERQLTHLVRLIDDLLETSRISRGLFELRREPVEIAHALRNALETTDPLIRQNGHALYLELPSEPLWVSGDTVRLSQCFANLLNNAARYTPPGGRISVRAARGVDGTVRVHVRDTGMGLSDEAKSRLFQMFARGQGSQGLGIGLALVRKLIEMHGGSVEAKSDGCGAGTEFIITLPAAQAPVATAPVGVSPTHEKRYRVLVADDNHDAAEALAMLLRAMGNEVAVAHDGQEAVHAASTFRPQVIFLDVGMPRLDGYQAAREIRRQTSGQRMKIVALTGWGQDEDRRRAREAGFDEHLVKPAEVDALRRVMST